MDQLRGGALDSIELEGMRGPRLIDSRLGAWPEMQEHVETLDEKDTRVARSQCPSEEVQSPSGP